jgi:transglutaminase-like putative cysteine protease
MYKNSFCKEILFIFVLRFIIHIFHKNNTPMKTILKVFYIISISSLSVSLVNAQKYKYGKVTNELLMLNECDFFKNADAMVTYIGGKSEVRYYDNEGFKVDEEVKKQIKIFNSESNDIGNIEFYFYSPKAGSAKVKLRSLKGKTYNLINNKIEETKLLDENIFETQFNNYYKKVTIAMPNMQKNCVFEFEYKLVSDYYTNINDWNVQENYPVLFNEFYTSVPEYYKYQINIVGGAIPVKDEKSTKSQVINYRVETYNEIGAKYRNEQVNIVYNSRAIVFENVLPVEDEPFTANKADIGAKITHQLIMIQWPNEPVRTFATNYQALNNELLVSETFGKKIKDGDFIKNYIDITDDTSGLVRAEKVYDFFTNKTAWDGYNHYRTDKSGKTLLKEGKGDAGDINLNYIAALNYLGIPTFPVLLSTRGNGTLHPIYPDYSDFNYVVGVSVINEKLVFSDATSDLPFGYLPLRCLNGNGWIVSENGADWINMKNDFSGKRIVQTEITIDENVLNYSTKIQHNNYFAFADLEKIKKSNEDEFLKQLNPESEFKLDSISILEKKPNLIKFRELFSTEINDENLIYIKPFVHLPYPSNPFKREIRKSIIDFPFMEEYKFVTIITLNDNYTYETPVNLNTMLNENSMSLKYTSSYTASLKKLTIIADLKISKTFYTPEEYPDLKSAFDVMVNKLNEPVVLKKI